MSFKNELYGYYAEELEREIFFDGDYYDETYPEETDFVPEDMEKVIRLFELGLIDKKYKHEFIKSICGYEGIDWTIAEPLMLIYYSSDKTLLFYKKIYDKCGKHGMIELSNFLYRINTKIIDTISSLIFYNESIRTKLDNEDKQFIGKLVKQFESMLDYKNIEEEIIPLIIKCSREYDPIDDYDYAPTGILRCIENGMIDSTYENELLRKFYRDYGYYFTDLLTLLDDDYQVDIDVLEMVYNSGNDVMINQFREYVQSGGDIIDQLIELSNELDN